MPTFEQARNGNGTTREAVFPGGKTRKPAAVTGWHAEGEKLPASTTRIRAGAPFSGASFTRCDLTVVS